MFNGPGVDFEELLREQQRQELYLKKLREEELRALRSQGQSKTRHFEKPNLKSTNPGYKTKHR